jgi:hypothetical protein
LGCYIVVARNIITKLLVQIGQPITFQDSTVGNDVAGIVSGDGENNVMLDNNGV